jgi:hypothetical protein
VRVAAIRELLDRGFGRPGSDSQSALEIPIRDGSDHSDRPRLGRLGQWEQESELPGRI